MKKLILFIAAGLVFASCSIIKSSVQNTSVKNPVLSTTVVSLDVAKEPITYTYRLTEKDKVLTFDEVFKNAQYQALKEYGKGDVMIEVSYTAEGKRTGRTVRKIKSITITGYPATYKNFREPTVEDRANIEAFYPVGAPEVEGPKTFFNKRK